MLIIFDLDDTLVDTSGTITPFKLKAALLAMVKEGLVIPDIEKGSEMLLRINEMSISSSRALDEFLQLHDGNKKFLDIGERILYEEELGDYPVFPVDSACEVLEDLQLTTSHQMAIVSIGDEKVQRQKLVKSGISEKYFSQIIICRESEKERHYEQLCKSYRLLPSQVVVCGDRIIRDLQPAKRLGMHTVQMLWGRGLNDSDSKSDVDYAILSLRQLKEIVAGLI